MLFRKIFHFFFLLKRPMTLGVRAIIEDERGRILLVRHTYVKGWYFPGGGVENGQTLEQALAMELREEVNIADKGDVELIGIYRNTRYDHVGLYCCKNWSGMGEFTANREIAEIGFFQRDKLPSGTTKATLARLAEVYDGEVISKDW
ncbi:MAG: NUDIX domain-containing protein [Rhizobiaceae bacterium]|nr:NUDIX domain-containing protein [Rhizobiaceae bacterium]